MQYWDQQPVARVTSTGLLLEWCDVHMQNKQFVAVLSSSAYVRYVGLTAGNSTWRRNQSVKQPTVCDKFTNRSPTIQVGHNLQHAFFFHESEVSAFHTWQAAPGIQLQQYLTSFIAEAPWLLSSLVGYVTRPIFSVGYSTSGVSRV